MRLSTENGLTFFWQHLFLIRLARVVSDTVEFVPVLQPIFATEPRQKKITFHFEQGMTMVDPFTHRTKAVTATPSRSMEGAPST